VWCPQNSAQDFIGASIEKPEPGEIIDRAQLAGQLRAAGDDITNADVEAVTGMGTGHGQDML